MTCCRESVICGICCGFRGIDRVEIWMNGEYKFDAPYGGPAMMWRPVPI